MKHLLFLCLLFTGVCSFSQLSPVENPFPNPGNLNGYIHLSTKKNEGKIPLIVVLHGCNQNAEEVAHDSGWNKLADSLGFHVLYPEQQTRNNITTCFNWFLEADHDKNKGEVYSIERMIGQTVDSLPIDTTRIFIYGVSAGGAMAAAMMVDYPQLFAGGAILAGVPFGLANNAGDVLGAMIKPKDFLPEEWAAIARAQNPDYHAGYPKLIVMHGTEDRVVNITAGYELVEQWTALNKISIKPSARILNYRDKAGLNRLSFNDNSGNEHIVFYEMQNWGHAMMIDPGDGAQQGGKTGQFSKDGDFWSTYWIAKDFGL